MKERHVLKFAKILLISQKKEDYICLQNVGFQRITCFSSPKEAFAFFANCPEKIKEYSALIERYTRGVDFLSFRQLLWENKTTLIRVELYEERSLSFKDTEEAIVEKFFNGVKISCCPFRQDLKQKCVIDSKRFTNIPMDKICELLLRKLKNKEPVLQIKDFKILYVCGYSKINKLVLEQKLKKRGFRVTIKDWYEENISFASYDIVLLQDDFVLKNRPEIERDSFFYVDYSFTPFSASISDYSLSYVLGKHVSVTCKEQKNEKKINYLLSSNDIYEQIMSVFMVTIQNVCEMMGISHPKECISSTDYTEKYLEKEKLFLEEQRKRLLPIIEFNFFVSLLDDFFAFQVHLEKNPYGIVVRKIEDCYCIQNLYDGKVNGEIRIPFFQEEFLKRFSIRLVSAKGTFLPFSYVSIFSSEYSGKDASAYPNKKEFAMYQNIRLKSLRLLPPVIEMARHTDYKRKHDLKK